MYEELFKAVHIWNEYQDELDSIGYDEGHIKNEKEKENTKSIYLLQLSQI